MTCVTGSGALQDSLLAWRKIIGPELPVLVPSSNSRDLHHGHFEAFQANLCEQREEPMFIELTPLVQWSPQLINLATVRQIEPVKSNQVNFTRIHFADFSKTLDVYEKYEEVKTILSQAHLVLQATQSDSAHVAHSQEAA